MNKKLITQLIINHLTEQAENIAKAATIAHQDATNSENKPENKYDTRGLEASYLAEAQSKISLEICQNIKIYQELTLRNFNKCDFIALGALIKLSYKDQYYNYFLGPAAGGVTIDYQGANIIVISYNSPIGQSFIGKEIGDEISIMNNGQAKIFEIIDIL